ncbi:methyltransferase domain-containing protein [Paracoccus suum]|uniref:Methyltransferase domain-containing protein n=1 Tax=Paracoccus suum TaxID=2259340 RepID=A0A344PHE4_9RHOB|nr:methyltransferase domain-containing protein [Paracoccus suum]AXC48799.1 methyltransferase domain-containing protein [Paracoccus suum]
MASLTTETRCDGFLGGGLRLAQPVHGYRAGTDAVMLAAACPACVGQSVLEVGCGVGAAVLCLGYRVPGLALTGLEVQPAYAALARENAARNGLPLQVVQGDLLAMPPGLRGESFDHVLMNPPFFVTGTVAPDSGRGIARHEAVPLRIWIDAGLRRLNPGGWLTLIHKAERLASILAALEGRAGDMRVLPIAARAGRPAGRVIVVARKGARGPLALLAPFVLHALPDHASDAEDLTPAAQRVLRHGGAILL